MPNQNGENTLMSVAFFEVPNVYSRKIRRGVAIGLVGLGVIAGIAVGIRPPAVPEWCSEPPHVDTPDTPGRVPQIIIAKPVSPTHLPVTICVDPADYKILR
jgi:hypothetical protein